MGSVVKQPVLTSEGVDLDSFSNPILQFTIEQLTDQNNKLLPVLQGTLVVSTVAELSKTQEFSSINTNRWSVYLEKTNNIQEVIKKALPNLLNQFITDFQRSNTNKKNPTFYISYDASWWKIPEQK